jgi:hypothetical protein
MACQCQDNVLQYLSVQFYCTGWANKFMVLCHFVPCLSTEACDFMDWCLGLCTFFSSTTFFLAANLDWSAVLEESWYKIVFFELVQECLVWDIDKVLFVVLWMTPFLFWRLVPFPQPQKGAIWLSFWEDLCSTNAPVSGIFFFFCLWDNDVP